MPYSPRDQKRLFNFYNPLIAAYGCGDARAEGWASEENKKIRMQVLAEIGDLENASILDVGCGVGDFYGYLKSCFSGIRYRGIDINAHMIAAARGRHPDADFMVGDFGDFECPERYDYAFASGVFSFKIPDYKVYYFSVIQKMFECSRRGIGFNLLDSRRHIDNETFATYTVAQAHADCAVLTDKITIRQDYLDHDFTVYVYR